MVTVFVLLVVGVIPVLIASYWPIPDDQPPYGPREIVQAPKSNERIIRDQYVVIPELEVRVRNKRPYAHIRLGPDYTAEDVQWLNEQQALLEIPTLPFVRL